MVDTSMAPPPIANQQGDVFIEGGYSLQPQTSTSTSQPSLNAVTLGVGYSATDLDFMYLNTNVAFEDLESPDLKSTISFRYLRKFKRNGTIEHHYGPHLQLGTAVYEGSDGNQVYNGLALGLGYIARINAPGRVQAYGGLQAGYGFELADSPADGLVGTLALGLQYRPLNYLEFRTELNHSIFAETDFEIHSNVPGFTIQARYIF